MTRLDRLLVERHLVESREKAQSLIESGQVVVNGRTVTKPAAKVSPGIQIELLSRLPYVGRGGLKLEAAFQQWNRPLDGKICADVGASTGGFTDFLLQQGAARVYAIDTGTDQLHRSLRQNLRVISMEKTNVRFLESLPEQVDLVTMDVSFISVRLLLPVVSHWLSAQAEVWVLLKPQFEAPEQTHKGVIRHESIRNEILQSFLVWCEKSGWWVVDHFLCPITGEKGNREYWVRLQGAREAPRFFLVSCSLCL